MKILFTYLGVLLAFATSCQLDDKPIVAGTSQSPSDSWIDTVRFNTKLTVEQHQQVYFARNYEENYRDLQDTARIMLRFFWSRAFHPFVVARLENRPDYYDSAGTIKKYEEWFATYKEDVRRINHDCPLRKNDRCYGKVRPFIHRQGVEILPANQTPSLLAALDSIDYWKMKPTYNASPHTDGSSWTLQVYYKGRLHEVTTDLKDHPIKAVCLRLLKLSRYPAKSDEIY